MTTIIIQPTVSGITTEKAAHRNRRASVWRTPSKQAHRGSCHIHITLSRCNSCFCCILLHAITWHRLTSGLLGKYEQGNFGKPLAQQDQQTQWRLWIWCASMWCYAMLCHFWTRPTSLTGHRWLVVNSTLYTLLSFSKSCARFLK